MFSHFLPALPRALSGKTSKKFSILNFFQYSLSDRDVFKKETERKVLNTEHSNLKSILIGASRKDNMSHMSNWLSAGTGWCTWSAAWLWCQWCPWLSPRWSLLHWLQVKRVQCCGKMLRLLKFSLWQLCDGSSGKYHNFKEFLSFYVKHFENTLYFDCEEAVVQCNVMHFWE